MTRTRRGRIRVGVGGWTYEPWRGSFYPDGLAPRRELEYASGRLTSIEINGTFYGSQKPETFEKWHDETPDDFVFALKAPRFATNRKVLAEAGSSIERFFAGGVMRLGDKLGPVNWQVAASKKFDSADFEGFLKLLPRAVDGRTVRHAVEVRHSSFQTPEFVELAREHGVAVVVAGDSEYPQIPDLTAPFAYVRIMGSSGDEVLGYSEAKLNAWAARARSISEGGELSPTAGKRVSPSGATHQPRDVFLYVIGGHKVRNPDVAMALLERVG